MLHPDGGNRTSVSGYDNAASCHSLQLRTKRFNLYTRVLRAFISRRLTEPLGFGNAQRMVRLQMDLTNAGMCFRQNRNGLQVLFLVVDAGNYGTSENHSITEAIQRAQVIKNRR